MAYNYNLQEWSGAVSGAVPFMIWYKYIS